MKIKSFIILMFCCVAIAANAKELKTAVFTTSPEMHCSNCENKIKSNLRFEKGIKDIVTNLDDKTVTIKYDASKTSPEKIVDAFAKIDYVATEVGAVSASSSVTDVKPVSGGCCGSSVACSGEAAAETEGVAYFKAVQMSCGGCAAKVKKTLSAIEGVDSVEVTLADKSVKVLFDKSKVDINVLKDGFSTINYASQLFYPGEDNVRYASFKADQIKCGGCAGKVRNLLTGKNGVKDVTVCLPTKVVSVAYDSNDIDVDSIIKAFGEIGYEVSEVYKR